MSLTRRTVLKWTAIGSGAVAVGGHAAPAQAASPAVSITPLVGGSPTDDGFLAGIRRGLGATAPGPLMVLDPRDPEALSHLQRRLAGLGSSRIVGLLDEARYAVVAEFLRELGAGTPCVGRHTVTADGASHHFLSAPSACGVGTALAAGLAPGGGFRIRETPIGGGAASRGIATRIGPEGGWVGMTGEALARIAAGTWVPGPAGAYADARPTTFTKNHGLVSFTAWL